MGKFFNQVASKMNRYPKGMEALRLEFRKSQVVIPEVPVAPYKTEPSKPEMTPAQTRMAKAREALKVKREQTANI